MKFFPLACFHLGVALALAGAGAVTVTTTTSSSTTTSSTTTSSTTTSTTTMAPPRFSYQDLLSMQMSTSASGADNSADNQQQRQLLMSTLETLGIFSITDIPLMAQEKTETLNGFADCVDALLLIEQKHGDTDTDTTAPSLAARHTFPDGTVRKTVAVSSTDSNNEDKESTPLGWNMNMNNMNGKQLPSVCDSFQQSNGAFRNHVAEVTRTVGNVIGGILMTTMGMDMGGDRPSLLVDQNGNDSYQFQDIVTHGTQLEHFHAYSKPSNSNSNSNSSEDVKTLEMHTDQGLMLVFSPGRVQGQPSQQDFFIQMADTEQTVVAMEFNDKDELVVMMGDGVNQYVNSKHRDGTIHLRSVPHTLSVKQTQDNQPRVWYGRMVLPPSTAVHPLHPQNKTFGQVRAELIANPKQNGKGLGCSSVTGTTTSAREQRFLQQQDVTEESCSTETQSYCWHRCMNYTDNISPNACAAANTTHEVGCINSARELWSGNHDMVRFFSSFFLWLLL